MSAIASAILGIDISKRPFDVAVLASDGEPLRQAAFDNTPDSCRAWADWLTASSVAHVHACLEATGRYGLALATWLVEAGHAVSRVNPKIINAFADPLMTPNKTDRLDARLSARYAQLHPPATLWPTSMTH